MKVISVSQPFAHLIVKGCKLYETRSWPAPASLIGQRIGIASTKNMPPDVKAHIQEPNFQACYERTALEEIDLLPRGFLLGTAKIESVTLMTADFMDEVSDEEKAYGWWELCNYAWHLREVKAFNQPIIVSGKQGFWDWNGVLPNEHRATETAD